MVFSLAIEHDEGRAPLERPYDQTEVREDRNDLEAERLETLDTIWLALELEEGDAHDNAKDESL